MQNGPGTNYFAPLNDDVSIALTSEDFTGTQLAIYAVCNGNPNAVALQADTFANGCVILRTDLGIGNNVYYMTGTTPLPAWTLAGTGGGGGIGGTILTDEIAVGSALDTIAGYSDFLYSTSHETFSVGFSGTPLIDVRYNAGFPNITIGSLSGINLYTDDTTGIYQVNRFNGSTTDIFQNFDLLNHIYKTGSIDIYNRTYQSIDDLYKIITTYSTFANLGTTLYFPFAGPALNDCTITGSYTGTVGLVVWDVTIDGSQRQSSKLNSVVGIFSPGDIVDDGLGNSATVVTWDGTTILTEILVGDLSSATVLNDSTSGATANVVGFTPLSDTVTWTDGTTTLNNQLISGGVIPMSYGMEADFGLDSGHTVGDAWQATVVATQGLTSELDALSNAFGIGDLGNTSTGIQFKFFMKDGYPIFHARDINGRYLLLNKLVNFYSMGDVDDILNHTKILIDDSNISTTFVNKVGFAHGENLPSATDLVLGDDGNYFHVNGTTDIKHINLGRWLDGMEITLYFDDALTLNDNDTSGGTTDLPMYLAGSGNALTVTGARFRFILDMSLNSGNGAWLETSRTYS